MNKPETHAAPADSAVVANGKGLVNHKTQGIHVAPAVLSAATTNEGELLSSLLTVPGGLTQTEAEDRLRSSGPNEVAQQRPQGWPLRLLKIVRNRWSSCSQPCRQSHLRPAIHGPVQ